MASVRRKAGSQYWFACYKMPDGTRKQVSTRQTDRNLAMQIALKLELASDVSSRGMMTRDTALKLVNEITAMSGVQVMDPVTCRNFLTSFFDGEHGWSSSTRRHYQQYCRDFLQFLGPRADMPLATIQPAQIAEWRDARLSDGLSMKSVKSSMIVIEVAFKEALDQRRIEKNPFEGIKRPTVRKREVKRPFTWDHFAALVKATEGDWRLCILIGGYTGQRQQDVAQLEWSQVDFERKCITFRRRKTHDELTVPMHSVLAAELAEAWIGAGRPPAGKVIPEVAALGETGARGFPAVFREQVLPKIGIVQPYAERSSGKRGRTVSEYSYHSLRHMLSTTLNAIGVSPETRMLVVGHSDKRVSAGYTHAQLADAEAAIQRLGGV
ncbi:MAG: tyrosine-type recombinase/integrase [Opitutales bacterium]|nr:tyrosine-type recombinase/integrase [Opitutales bacterium]